MAISKFTPQSAKKDTGRTIGDNEVAKLANLNKIVTEVNTIFGGTANQLLAANGSSVSAGQNITISNGTISAAGGGGGSSFTLTTVGTLGTASKIIWTGGVKVFAATAAGTQTLSVISYPIISIGTFGGFNGTLSSITISDLDYLELSLSGISTLVTVSLPALANIINTGMNPNLYLSQCPSLTTVNIPSLSYVSDSLYISWTGNAFSQATVDNILVKFAATTAANCTLDLSGGTSSAPSATGLAAKATLQGRGWNVTTN